MKISYRTHPSLLFMHNQDLKGTEIISHPDDVNNKHLETLGEYANKLWKDNCLKFKKNIFNIADTFVLAVEQNTEKLIDLFLSEYIKPNEPLVVCGTHLRDKNMTVHYYLRRRNYLKPDLELCTQKGTPINEYFDYVLYVFVGKALMIFSHNIPNDLKGASKTPPKDTDAFTYISTGIIFKGGAILDQNYVWGVLAGVILLHLFQQYAKVETKYLPPKQKTKDFHCKYINDTDFGVTELDCRWFTTLVQSEGFKVRGHFRLQPKKVNGEWTKELIWINDFQKNGYTYQARKLLTEYTEEVI
jgi:hypothetical protein